MSDLTDLGVAAIRDGVAAGGFAAREVAEAPGVVEFPILPERVAELLLRSEPIAFAR